MTKTKHVIDPAFKSCGKMQLMTCRHCETKTLHTTPFFGYPFRCVANHGNASLCDGCEMYVDHFARVEVDSDGRHKKFCELCCEPDSPEKQQCLEERRRAVTEEATKPLDLKDPLSIARTLGASSFSVKR